MKTYRKKKTLAFDFTKATLYIGFHTSRNKTLAFDLTKTTNTMVFVFHGNIIMKIILLHLPFQIILITKET
jgi:hypothetical protein